MKLDVLLHFIRWFAIFVAAALLIFKFIDVRRYKLKNNRPLKARWFSWYSSMEVVGSSSSSRRDIMQRSNLFSTIIWICVALAAAVSLLPTP